MNAGELDFMSWYMEIPVISRVYLTSSVLITAACLLDIISPFSLYFDFDLIFFQGQVWRLFTPYLFFGSFSVHFLFNMYFLVRHCRMLEEGDFRGRTAHFVLMILFGIAIMTVLAPFFKLQFLGNSLILMVVYVWGKRNEDTRMNIFGIFSFTAPYLPWVMMAFSALRGNPVKNDIIGIFVGHCFYFLEYIYPVVADIRGWKVKKVMEPPQILHWLCGTYPEFAHLHQD